MCLPTCPTYDATKRERNSPRGRIALMRAIADGELERDARVRRRDELLPRLPGVPDGVPGRRELRRAVRDGAQRHRAVRRRIGAGARTFWRAADAAGSSSCARARCVLPGACCGLSAQRPRSRSSRRLGLMRAAAGDAAAAGAAGAADGAGVLESRSSRRTSSRAVRPRYRVALLTGCVQDLVFSDVNRDTADVLLANGCAVDTPPLQPCCGSLHAHNGERELARELARRMIDLLPPDSYDAIITNAGGCGSHLRHYGHAARPTIRTTRRGRGRGTRRCGRARVAGRRSAAARPRPRRSTQPVTVTYHESCHLAHGQKVSRAAARASAAAAGRVARRAAGVHLVLRQRRHLRPHAAGTGRRAAAAQGRPLADHARRAWSRPPIPGCHLQIARGLRDAGQSMDVAHPVSLLARAYRREGSTL